MELPPEAGELGFCINCGIEFAGGADCIGEADCIGGADCMGGAEEKGAGPELGAEDGGPLLMLLFMPNGAG